jgi:queuosine precursor transporter
MGKGVFSTAARLVLPVLFLTGAYALAYFAESVPIHLFDNQPLLGQEGLAPSRWLRAAHLIILIAFFAVMITNRVYGPAFALLQVVLSWIILGAVVLFGWANVDLFLPQLGTQPDLIAAWPFLVALFAAHVLSIILFDAMRGYPWWRAPLLGGLSGAVVLPVLFWGLGHEPGTPWISALTLDLALKVVVAFTLLGPYALLRPLAKPRNGFGGY